MSVPSQFNRASKIIRNEGVLEFIIESEKYLFNVIIPNYIPTKYYIRIAPTYWRLKNPKRFASIRKTQHEGAYVIIHPDGEEVFTPNPEHKDDRRLHPSNHMRDNSLSGSVSVTQGDVVVDVGSFIGDFSIGAAEDAKTVYAIEADPTNVYCTRQNTAEYNNIEVIHRAVWNESSTIDFHIGIDSTDSSILSPDFGDEMEIVKAPADTLDTIFSQNGIDDVDFLKMDVEGVEPEALEGLQDILPRKIAIDAGAERNGEDTTEEVIRILKEKNYETQTRYPMVFGKLNS